MYAQNVYILLHFRVYGQHFHVFVIIHFLCFRTVIQISIWNNFEPLRNSGAPLGSGCPDTKTIPTKTPKYVPRVQGVPRALVPRKFIHFVCHRHLALGISRTKSTRASQRTGAKAGNPFCGFCLPHSGFCTSLWVRFCVFNGICACGPVSRSKSTRPSPRIGVKVTNPFCVFRLPHSGRCTSLWVSSCIFNFTNPCALGIWRWGFRVPRVQELHRALAPRRSTHFVCFFWRIQGYVRLRSSGLRFLFSIPPVRVPSASGVGGFPYQE